MAKDGKVTEENLWALQELLTKGIRVFIISFAGRARKQAVFKDSQVALGTPLCRKLVDTHGSVEVVH